MYGKIAVFGVGLHLTFQNWVECVDILHGDSHIYMGIFIVKKRETSIFFQFLLIILYKN